MIKGKNIYFTILSLAFPVIIQDISTMLLQLTDSAMVGHLGAVAIASVAINTAPMWLFSGIGSAIAVGGSALVARSIGAEEVEKASHVSVLAWLFNVFLGFLLSVFLLLFAKKLTILMGADNEIIKSATQYVRIVGISYIFQFSTMMLCAVFRSTGNFKIPMYLNMLLGVLNIIGNFTLIYPTRQINIGYFQITLWGANMGVLGAALSTTISTIIIAILTFLLLKTNCKIINFNIKSFRSLEGFIWLKMIKISSPIFFERIVTSLGQMFFFKSVALLGTTLVAANSLALEIEAISYTPAYGFGSAASILIAISLGEKNVKKAYQIAKISWFLSLFYMSICSILFILMPNFFLSIFTKSHDVIFSGFILVQLLSIMQPFYSSTLVFGEVLKGSGDTRCVMIIAMICKGIIRIATTYLFVYIFRWGIIGAWLAMILDQCTQGILIYIRFRSGKWAIVGGI